MRACDIDATKNFLYTKYIQNKYYMEHLTCTLRKSCKIYVIRKIVIYKSCMILRGSLHSVYIFL